MSDSVLSKHVRVLQETGSPPGKVRIQPGPALPGHNQLRRDEVPFVPN